MHRAADEQNRDGERPKCKGRVEAKRRVQPRDERVPDKRLQTMRGARRELPEDLAAGGGTGEDPVREVGLVCVTAAPTEAKCALSSSRARI